MVRRSIVGTYFTFALCITGGGAQYNNCTDGNIESIGNGYCNMDNNNEGCLYDGGGCCECISIDGGSSYSDTSSSYLLCVDPSSPCYSPTAAALQSNCTDGDIAYIGNGWCDVENNNEGCLFDGGDCCSCTCVSGPFHCCGLFGFTCLDPEVDSLEPYICEESQPSLPTCSAGLQREWVVENTAHARALAEAVRCSGESFDVTWKGKVIVDQTISIFDGTILNVTSINTDSAIVGDGKTRLFSVVHASLHTSNITVSNGNANYGGAIAASRSRLSFNGVAFTDNTATNDGGALHLSNGTTASLVGETYFLNNTASNGGALCVIGGSNTIFANDVATSDERALYLLDNSSAVWTAEAHFLHNRAGWYGGALYLDDSSSAVWTAEAHFLNNSARWFGGAVYLYDSSSADWMAGTHFLHNRAGWFGGALYLDNSSNAVWTAEAHFLHNRAGWYGGALYLLNSSSAVWTAEAHFLNNSAGWFGGALYLDDNSSAVWTAEAHFLNNSARWFGGVLYLYESSSAVWTAEAHFPNNRAGWFGGALYLDASSNAVWTAKAHFLNNRAGWFGGALYLYDSSSAGWTAEVHFLSNSAGWYGGILYLDDSSSAVWTAEAHFLNNRAGWFGGALYLYDSSSADWMAGTHFLHNRAGWFGGALYLDNSSNAVWTAEAHFLHNRAGWYGGALYLLNSSSAVWTAEAHFLNNSAGWFGGALYLDDNSSAVWTAEAHFLNNSARWFGGVLYLYESSSAVWTAEAHFPNNRAGWFGGALYLDASSNAVWTAKAHFLNNRAGWFGGALYLYDSSSAGWTAEVHFLSNSAGWYGGILYLDDSSSAVWTAEAHFLNNRAGWFGGALYLDNSSSAVWTVEARFLNNSAGLDGGAVYMVNGCIASWKGETNFSENTSTGGRGGVLYVDATSSANWTAGCFFARNSAGGDGGAVYAGDSVSLSWSNKTLFVENIAHNGGAFFASNGVNVQWAGETNFISNYARLNGGAVGCVSANKRSVFAINGTASFENNTCGGNGGAMSVVNSLALVFDSKDIIFLRNSAGASGGAVSASFTGIGIVFKKVKFVKNSAQIGGAVHSTGSGTEVTVSKDNEKVINPMTVNGCSFLSNYAIATGGAVDSASGQDVFVRTSFKGNKAKVGGALRLAGSASIENCSFEDNTSELDGGPAVSNVGYISNVSNTYFNRNVFKCEAPMFLDFNEVNSSDGPFETACDGCPSKCFECSYGDGQGSPTCTSLSEAGMKHATSKGGYTTVEGLLIHEGYWRATNTSRNILRCFKTKACEGGLTGASDYCFQGYKGPYCSVCSKNYVSSLRFTCRECSNPTVSIAIAILLIALVLVVGFVIALHLVGTGRGIIDRVTERVPLQSVKIIIIVWQILTQFTSVANVKYPNVYQRLLNGVNFFNFDLSWVVSVGCFLHVDFHYRLLWTTLTPLVIIALLRGTYAIIVHRNIDSPETVIGNIQHKYISMALLVTFLVYSSVSSVVFQMFCCDDLDDGKSYLRADYTIDCDSSKHRLLQIYSGLMVIIYPVGIPALYAGMLFSNRHVLREEGNREGSPVVRSISNLWKPYKPQRFYYEVIECARRILLTGVIAFIYPNSAAQVAATFAIAVVFIFVSEGMAPYESPWDAWISRMGQAIVFASMYLALLLKVNVSGENDGSQKMFVVILVACHACMILAVILQVMITAISLRAVRQQEDPRPRLRRPSNSTRRIDSCLVEDYDSISETSYGPVAKDGVTKDEL